MKIFKKFIMVIIIIFTLTFLNNILVFAHIPINPQFYAFGLLPYESDSIDIKCKEVTFNLQIKDLGRYQVNEKYLINVSENKTLKVALPIIDTYGNIELFLNENKILPQIFYGREARLSYNFDKDKILNAVDIDEEMKKLYISNYRYDENLKGYYYTIKNSSNVSFPLSNQKIIYNRNNIPFLENGTFVLRNPNNITSDFSFFVIGNDINLNLNSEAYTSEIITYNEYFDRAFEEANIEMRYPGIFAYNFDLFLMSDKKYESFQFFNVTDYHCFKLYVFELNLTSNITNTINVNFPIQPSTNQFYDPMKWIFNYQSNNDRWNKIDEYSVVVKTGLDNPHLIDGSIKFSNLETQIYQSTIKSDVISFSVSESKHPLRLLFWEGNNAILQYVIAGAFILTFIAIIYGIIRVTIKITKKFVFRKSK